MLPELIAWAKEFLGPLYLPLYHLFHVLFPFTAPDNLHWFFLASGLAIALYFYLGKENSAGPKSVSGFARYVAPKSIYLHESAIDDYKFYVVNQLFLLKFGAWVAGLWGMFSIAGHVRMALSYLLGAVPPAAPGALALGLYSLVLFCATDYGKWLAHFLEHKVPLLWEFHKVHHSAEVLTPVTNYRLHPVDYVVEQSIRAVISGIVVGVFSYRFHASGLVEYTVFNMGIFSALSWLTNYLRHSHIPVSFGRLDYVFSSPVLHQLHHSSEPRHHDKNFALVFSFWDYFAGTLYAPKGLETYRLGLYGEQPRPYRGVVSLYFAPFRSALAMLARRMRGRNAGRSAYPAKERHGEADLNSSNV